MVGVIVRLEKEAFKVLTQHGKELDVPHNSIEEEQLFCSAGHEPS